RARAALIPSRPAPIATSADEAPATEISQQTVTDPAAAVTQLRGKGHQLMDGRTAAATGLPTSPAAPRRRHPACARGHPSQAVLVFRARCPLRSCQLEV